MATSNTEDVPDLVTFAKERHKRGGAGPWMERELPPDVLEECITAWDKGIRATAICEWLKLKGYEDVTKGKVGQYFVARGK